MKQYKYLDVIYSVVTCTIDDIPSHIERVLSYWTDAKVNVDEQISLLKSAVSAGTAYKVIDNEGASRCFIYCNRVNRQVVQSNLLWLENKRMFAILCYYLRLTANIRKILFKPHTKDFIPFEFVVKDTSIRMFYSHGTPLEIDLYSPKSEKVYKQHFLKYDIKEL